MGLCFSPLLPVTTRPPGPSSTTLFQDKTTTGFVAAAAASFFFLKVAFTVHCYTNTSSSLESKQKYYWTSSTELK